MIPKIIHYVWLGGKELPPLETKCMLSWRKYNPEYEILCWDEQNLNINDPVYLKAYSKKQWAYCSDYARLKILKENGGIYLDTDIEVVRCFDDLLNQKCFLGKENSNDLNAAVIGSVKGHEFICDVFDEIKLSLKTDFVPIPRILNSVYDDLKYKDVTVYDEEYFYPYNPFCNEIKLLFYCDVTTNTYAIHHWNYSWKPSFASRIFRMTKRILKGSKYFNYKEKI